MAHFVTKSRDTPPNSLHIVWDEAVAAKDKPAAINKTAYSTGTVPQLYEYMETHTTLPPSRFVDGAGKKKNDQRRTAFIDAVAGRQYVELIAHFVSKSRDNPPNSLHIVWDEAVAKKNPKRKGLAQPTLADAFAKKARKKD